MVEDKAPVRRRRLGAHGLMFRRRRIFASLREGYTYDEIAAEEGVSPSRIRQIVSQELQQRRGRVDCRPSLIPRRTASSRRVEM